MKTPLHTRAFSLVEVTIAIAVLSFCLLTLLALVPMGLTSTTDSLQKTNAAGIVSQIAADLRDTPLISSTGSITTSTRYGLALDSTTTAPVTNSFYLDASGNPTGAAGAAITSGSIYKATVVIWSPKVAPTSAAAYSENIETTARIIVTWPAQSDRTPSTTGTGVIPTKYQGYFETVTELDRN